MKTRTATTIIDQLHMDFCHATNRRNCSNSDLDPVLSQDCRLVKEASDWLEYLREEDDEVMVHEGRSITRIGDSSGDDDFTSRIENILGRQLMTLPRGRPRKNP